MSTCYRPSPAVSIDALKDSAFLDANGLVLRPDGKDPSIHFLCRGDARMTVLENRDGWCEFEVRGSHDGARVASLLQNALGIDLISQGSPGFDDAMPEGGSHFVQVTL